ncbi:MAG: lipid A export permease/ATP-binding protein MsbA [Gammaproteobacteria bacterium GWE2_37_16]|nr:MAG: lipid A export permease/ATP-binding protein MsbA [Gammaproteobacteria bacterium GWE2_37_16]
MLNNLFTTKNSWAVYKKLLKSASSYWKIFLIGVVGTLLAAAADTYLTWMIKPIIDKGLVAHNKLFLAWMPVLIVAGFIVRGGMLFVSNYFIVRVGRSVVMDFRQKIFAHMLHLPASFFDRESSGQLLTLFLYSSDQLSSATTEATQTILQEGSQLIGFIVLMFVVSWKMSLLFIITVPLVTLIINHASKRLRMLNSKVQKTIGDIAHSAEELIQGYRVIRIFGGENYERKKFNKTSQHNRQCEMKVVVTNSLSTSAVQIIAALPIAMILYVMNLPFFHISVGSFGAIFAAMARLLTPIRRLTKIHVELQKGLTAANSIFNLLDCPKEQDTGALHSHRIKGKIEYRHVKFKYPEGHKNVLRDINFIAEPGKTVALVGRSGSGKSTLVSLLPRFYDVIDGEILIDDVNSKEYTLKSLRQQFALVSQNVILFDDTIARNISYGLFNEATEEKIMQAVEAAYLNDFVKQLPLGLETMIGENGHLLSGGQRQRIAIARAILKDAPILILDEATSALDTESEYYIQAALENLMRKRTTVVIAHRLSTVEKADTIMVMDQGKIIESGNHQELIAKNGQYAKLYKMQFKVNSQEGKLTKQQESA